MRTGRAPDAPRASPLAFLGARPVVSAVLGAGAIAWSAVFVRLSGTSASTAALFRCVYALPPLALLALIERKRFGPRSRREHTLAVWAGIAFAADLVMWHRSIDAVGAGLATVLGNLQVVVVGLLAWLILREHLDKRVLASIPVVVAGAVLVSGVLGADAFGEDPALGVGFGIGTSIAYAVFLLVHREGARDLRRPAGPLFEATIWTTVAILITRAWDTSLDLAPAWPSHGWLLLLAVTAQVIGWLLLSVSLPRLPAALSSVLLLLQPVGALILGAVVLGEDPSVVQYGGTALILAGVIFAARSRRTAPRAETPRL